MQVKKLDPVVWIIVALVGVAAVIVLIAFASRGCVLAMKEGFESAGARHSRYEDAKWATEAAELEPAEYAAFVEKAQAIDLGIGVHLGADMEHVETVLGAADTTGRAAGGGFEYTYLFFPGAEGPSSKQRHKGGLFSVVNSAALTVTAVDNKVAGFTFYATPHGTDDPVHWPFLTLNGKPLMQCTKDDLTALLGEPTETRYFITWRYALATPEDTLVPADGILVEAMMSGDTGFLYSLQIDQR